MTDKTDEVMCALGGLHEWRMENVDFDMYTSPHSPARVNVLYQCRHCKQTSIEPSRFSGLDDYIRSVIRDAI